MMKGSHWVEIRNDHKKGLSYTEIARKYHVDPCTAKKYAISDTKPAYQLVESNPSKSDPYKHLINLWLEEAPDSAVRIHEKLLEQGCNCKYTLVHEYVSTRKKNLIINSPSRPASVISNKPSTSLLFIKSFNM